MMEKADTAVVAVLVLASCAVLTWSPFAGALLHTTLVQYRKAAA